MNAATQLLWVEEAKKLTILASPIILTYLLSISIQLTTQIIVGHVSSVALAAAALATMFAHSFGLSIILGTASALDTLCSQAFGARNYFRVGQVAYLGCAVGLALCAAVGVAWYALAGPFFGLMGQDGEIASLSTHYLRLLLFGLPAQTLFETLKKPLTSANLPLVPLLFSAQGLLCAGALGYLFVYHTPLSLWGAPIAAAISHWLCLASLILYLRNHRWLHALVGLPPGGQAEGAGAPAAAPAAAAVEGAEDERAGRAQGGLAAQSSAPADLDSAVCVQPLEGAGAAGAAAEAAHGPAGSAAAPAALVEPPHPPYHDLLDQLFPMPTLEVCTLAGLREYLVLGAPGALMLFVEWGSYEGLTLIAGSISKTVLSAQAIMGTTATLSFMPFLGFSVACCIRVGNFLGELKPQEAQRAYHVTLAISLALVAFNTLIVLSGRSIWALLFTDDEAVTGMVSETMFLLATYTLFDGIQCVSTGALRGVSLPGPAAAINVVSYVGVGLPLAFLLSTSQYGLGMGLSGIWLGFCAAVLVAALCMTVYLTRTDWEDKAVQARKSGKAALGGH